jgi:hypothetical protein
MNTIPDENQPAGKIVCPRCKTTRTIAHNGGEWCPDCGAFAKPPDPCHTAHIQSTHASAQQPFLDLQADAEAVAAMPRCCKCQQPVDNCSGVYDDGDWLCGNCIAGYAR